jgi:hypothetical protein
VGQGAAPADGLASRRRDAPVRTVGTTTGRPRRSRRPRCPAGRGERAKGRGLALARSLRRKPGTERRTGSPEEAGPGVLKDAAAGASMSALFSDYPARHSRSARHPSPEVPRQSLGLEGRGRRLRPRRTRPRRRGGRATPRTGSSGRGNEGACPNAPCTGCHPRRGPKGHGKGA